MSPTPPSLARRLLERTLADDPAGPAILGDLHEDFVRVARARGPAAARRAYAWEALLLSTGCLARRARRTFFGDTRMSESSKLRALLLDALYARRSVRRTPGFALFTAGVIALGVGAATSVFSVLRPFVLAPLPFENAHELLWIANAAPPERRNSLSAVTSRSSNLRDFRERALSFEGITGWDAFFDQIAYTLTGTGEPERLVGVGVAHDFLDVLGVRPLLGRGFTAAEGVWDGPPVVILLPFAVADETDRRGNTMSFVGRLRAGVSPEAAQAELDAILQALEEEQPDRWGLGAEVTPLHAKVAGPFRPALLLLAAAAGTLLLIVVVNVSNLILARVPGRTREIAVRKALGASRPRLIRQLVLETLFISLAGAAVGSVLAWGATALVSGTAGMKIPLLSVVGVDGAALLFATLVAVGTGLVVGFVPALQVSEGGEAAALRSGGRGTSAGRSARRMREGLVVAEVTLACVLLVAGALLVRSFRAVLHVDLGFDPSDVVAWHLNPTGRFSSGAERAEFFGALGDRVAAVPGVEQVGFADATPLGRNRSWAFLVPGQSPEEDPTRMIFFPHLVDPGYLSAMRIPLVAGRNFTRDDLPDSEPVVVINETAARTAFGQEEAVGRRLVVNGREATVVGVAADVRHLSPELDAGVEIYLPLTQSDETGTLEMVVRSGLTDGEVTTAVSAALREIDPAMPTREFWTLEARVDRAVSARRFTLAILGAFGAAALLLAGLGIYGVLAHSVAERTNEIGIRMAFGASPAEVVRRVIGRTLVLAGVGVIVGAGLSLAGARLIGSLLFGVSATDPVAFTGMALLLLGVAALAGAVPALRVARLNGVRALQAD